MLRRMRLMAPFLLRPATLAAAAVFCLAAQAAPEPVADPLLRLLQDKPTATENAAAPTAPADATPPGFVSKMRDSASDMVVSAMNFLGVRYRRGGTSAEDGFDCSGFTRHVFESSLGLILPRRADEQASAPGLQKIKKDDLQPGDLVFFNTLKRTFSHVGIYVGEGKFIHAPRSGASVRVEDMRISYWTKRFTGARRPDGSAIQGGATPQAIAAPSGPGLAVPAPPARERAPAANPEPWASQP